MWCEFVAFFFWALETSLLWAVVGLYIGFNFGAVSTWQNLANKLHA